MLVVQPIYFRERDSHSDCVVAVRAIKREKDDCGAYFRAVYVVRAFDRTAFAKAGYGFASLFCHGEPPRCFQGQGFGACRWVLCRRRFIHPKSFSVNAILCKVASAAFGDSPATKDCGAFRDMPASEPTKRPTLNAIRLYRCERHSSANQSPRLHARTRSPADPGNADGLNPCNYSDQPLRPHRYRGERTW